MDSLTRLYDAHAAVARHDIKRCLPWKGNDSNLRFTDVSAGGIQVNGNYAGETILYDLSNKHDVVIDFVESAIIFKANYTNHH